VLNIVERIMEDEVAVEMEPISARFSNVNAKSCQQIFLSLKKVQVGEWLQT
jgi:hypothetical protein